MKRLALFVALSAVLATVAFAQEVSLTPIERLGKALFFENISQPSKSMSCATCHAQSAGWTGANAGINKKGAVYPAADPKRFGDRKPPTSGYVTFAPVLTYDTHLGEFVGGAFWDGRATGERLGSPAAEQALGPWLNPVEHNNPSKVAVCTAVSQTKSARLFEEVWGPGSLNCSAAQVDLTYDRFGISIAAYEGSLEHSPFSSKFDRYWRACLAAGNDPESCGLGEGPKNLLDPGHVLSEMEWDGLIEFGEYCAACHTSTVPGPGGRPPLFTDFTFANVGAPKNPANPFYRMDRVYLDNGQPINPMGADWIDLGLGGFLQTRPEWAYLAPMNDGKFRVPTLRNVDKRPGAPTEPLEKDFTKAYLHNGVFKSLLEVVRFYNTRDVPGAGWAPPEVDRNVNRELLAGKPLGNLELDADAERALVEFLKTLTDR